MKSATDSSNNTSTYTYDGEGKRIKRNIVGTETWQVYGIGGELIVEYAANGAPGNPQKEYGYRNGQLLITATVNSGGWGSPPTFNDNPLQVGVTIVQARHITELRTAINAVRSHYNLSAYSWQYSATTNDYISANPILEMRTALDQALGGGSYAAGLAQGQPVKAAHIQELRDRILAAWQSGSGGVDIRWLVTDQLGTPRMIFDQSGSLANTVRHDYLPFGEDLAGVGGRSSGLGYAGADGARQHFTGYERDNESGLDYAHARYYANMQGRFTSPDPFAGSMKLRNPQSFNRYTYVRNNPVKLVDPSGLDGAKFSMNSLDGNDIQNFINGQGGGAGDANVLADASDAVNELAAESDAPPPPAYNGDGTTNSAYGEQDDSADPQNPDQQYASDSTMVIAWDPSGWRANPLSYEGHVSYITEQNDTSYSFQSPFRWTHDQPSSKYTDARSTHTAGIGYILDFSHAGAEINAKFQKALLSARRGDIYDPFDNNCANPFVVAINAIHKEIGTPKFTTKHMPIDVKTYIEKYLQPKNFVVGGQVFPKH